MAKKVLAGKKLTDEILRGGIEECSDQHPRTRIKLAALGATYRELKPKQKKELFKIVVDLEKIQRRLLSF